jgi:hypothetical protein
MDSAIAPADFWKFLLLRTTSFEALRKTSGSLWISLRLFLIAGLIGSIGILTTGLAEAGQTTLADQLSNAATSLEDTAGKPFLSWTPGLASALTTLADWLDQAAAALVSVQPPLGTQASAMLRAVGAWLGQPLLPLTAWMALLLPLSLAARLMGGRGAIREQISLGLVAFLPQALVFLTSFHLAAGSPAESVAVILNVVAAVWSLAIWLTASAVANGYGRGQSAKVLLATVAALLAIGALAGWLLDWLSATFVSLLI